MPKRIITDKLRSYDAAKRDVMPDIEHRSHKGLNNRAENSHLPLRKRERAMQGFRSTGGLQRFISIFSALRNIIVTPRHKRSALANHIHRIRAIAHWKAVTGAIARSTTTKRAGRLTLDNVTTRFHPLIARRPTLLLRRRSGRQLALSCMR